ncbi:MAG: DRTGG domain-containing protein [Anaerolineae bacterium]
MKASEVVDLLHAEVVAGADNLDTVVTGGYASDLLSCVMASARAGNVWVTLQGHMNVIAIAVLLELSAVVITEGVRPDADVLARANEKRIPVLLYPKGTFSAVAELAQAGVAGIR